LRNTVVALGLVIAAALLMAGCSGGPHAASPPPVTPAQGPYVGAAVCRPCHSDVHAAWSGTKHHEALSVLVAAGQGTSANCIPCHVVGFGQPTGYTGAGTPQLANVQCENCHGPGGNHASNPSVNRMTVQLGAQLCGTCHTGFHHPNYEQWQTSKHAQALALLQSLPYATDACLQCHSVDAYLQAEDQVVLRTTAVVAQNPITCVLCHDPHEAAHTAQLRLDPRDVCIQCHTAGDTLPTGAPHHPQKEMLAGQGAFAADGSRLDVAGPHTTAVAERCVQCHVHQSAPPQPTVENPVNTGHTFLPDVPAACQECHPGNQASQFKAEVQGETEATLAQLGPYFTSGSPSFIDPATLNAADLARYNVAKFDWEFVTADKSRGVHNVEYTEQLLAIALDIVQGLAGGP